MMTRFLSILTTNAILALIFLQFGCDDAGDGDADGDVDGDADGDGPLAEWIGHWQMPTGTWEWHCTDAWGGSRGGTSTEEGDRRFWDIEALDDHRIRVSEDLGSAWNYVIEGDVGTLEEGSFSGGVDVDNPGNEIRAIEETVTLRSDGSILNEVYYEFTTPAGETCTEEQTITLTRE
jgi:hypothetical protein